MDIAVVSFVDMLSSLKLTIPDNIDVLYTGTFHRGQIIGALQRDWIQKLRQEDVDDPSFPEPYVNKLVDIIRKYTEQVSTGTLERERVFENEFGETSGMYTYQNGAITPKSSSTIVTRNAYLRMIRTTMTSYLSCFNVNYNNCPPLIEVEKKTLSQSEKSVSVQTIRDFSLNALVGEFYFVVNPDNSIAFMITAKLDDAGIIYIYNVCSNPVGMEVLRSASALRTTDVFGMLLSCVRYRLGTHPMTLVLVQTNPSFDKAYTIYNNNGFNPTIDPLLAASVVSSERPIDPRLVKDLMPMTTGLRTVHETMLSGVMNPRTNAPCKSVDNVLAVAYKHHCFYKSQVKDMKEKVDVFTNDFMTMLTGEDVFNPSELTASIPEHLSNASEDVRELYTNLYKMYQSYITDTRPQPVLVPENFRLQLINTMSTYYYNDQINVINQEILENSYFLVMNKYDHTRYNQGIYACKNDIRVRIEDYTAHPDPAAPLYKIDISTRTSDTPSSIYVPRGTDLTSYSKSSLFTSELNGILRSLSNIDFPTSDSSDINYYCHRFLWSIVTLQEYKWNPLTNQFDVVMGHANSVLFDTRTKNVYFFEPGRLIPESAYTNLKAMHRIYSRVFGRKIVDQLSLQFPLYNATGGRIIGLNDGYTACGMRVYSHVQDPSLDDESKILCTSLSMLSIIFFDMLISISIRGKDLETKNDELVSTEDIDFRKVFYILRYWLDSAKLLRTFDTDMTNTSSFFLRLFPIYTLFISEHMLPILDMVTSLKSLRISSYEKEMIGERSLRVNDQIDDIVRNFRQMRDYVVTLLKDEQLIQNLLNIQIPEPTVAMDVT